MDTKALAAAMVAAIGTFFMTSAFAQSSQSLAPSPPKPASGASAVQGRGAAAKAVSARLEAPKLGKGAPGQIAPLYAHPGTSNSKAPEAAGSAQPH